MSALPESVRRRRPARLSAALAPLAFFAAVATAPAAWADGPIVAISSGGFAQAFKELAPAYRPKGQKAGGQAVDLQFGPSMGRTPQAIPARLARGEAIDVVVMVGEALDELIAQGLVDGRTKVVLARSTIACAVPAGAPRPALETEAQVRDEFLQAPSVAWSDSASGEYIQTTLLARLGIASQVKAKGRQIPATPVGEIIASRQAAFGCQQRSELQPVAGIDIVGELPDALQKVTPYAAGVVTASRHRAEAQSFIDYLASPDSAAAIVRSGLHPTAR